MRKVQISTRQFQTSKDNKETQNSFSDSGKMMNVAHDQLQRAYDSANVSVTGKLYIWI